MSARALPPHIVEGVHYRVTRVDPPEHYRVGARGEDCFVHRIMPDGSKRYLGQVYRGHDGEVVSDIPFTCPDGYSEDVRFDLIDHRILLRVMEGEVER